MNPKERILAAHAAKTLAEPLSALSLYLDGKHVASGEGKLSSSTNGKLTIEVTADGIPFNMDMLPKGTIVPDSECYAIEAKTLDGIGFSAKELHAQNVAYKRNERDHAVFEPNQVRLVYAERANGGGWFEAFVTPFDCRIFNRVCRNGETNAVFGDRVSGRWFSLETAEAAIGLRKESDAWLHVKAKSKGQSDGSMEKYVAAFTESLSFLIGRPLECLGYSQPTEDGDETVLVNCRPHSQKKFYEPLAEWERAAAEKLLRCGMEYFQKHDCGPVLTALHVCWESRKVTFPANYLLVCSVVEGLANYILTDAMAQCSELRDLALTFLRKDPKAQESLYLEKFEKTIKAVEFFKDKESIRKAGEFLKITITPAELEAWGHLRNRLAHGNFSLDLESATALQSEFDRAACVANIVNKFVLALMRYEGVFCDYSVRGHPIRKFPC